MSGSHQNGVYIPPAIVLKGKGSFDIENYGAQRAHYRKCRVFNKKIIKNILFTVCFNLVVQGFPDTIAVCPWDFAQ